MTVELEKQINAMTVPTTRDAYRATDSLHTTCVRLGRLDLAHKVATLLYRSNVK